MLFSFWFVIHL